MSDKKTRSVELNEDDIQFLQRAVSCYAEELNQSRYKLDTLTLPVAIRRGAVIELHKYAERAGRLQQLLAPHEPKAYTTTFEIPMLYGYPTITDNIELVEHVNKLRGEGLLNATDQFLQEFPGLYERVCYAQRDVASQRVEGRIVPMDSLLEYIDSKVRITYKGAQSAWC